MRSEHGMVLALASKAQGCGFDPRRAHVWWMKLSGGELRARLLQRGLHPDQVERLLDHRDDCPDCQQAITDLIN